MSGLLMIVLALSAQDLAPLESFCENPSLEEDRNRDGAPDGWKAMAFDSPAQLAWDDSNSHSGSRSALIRDSFQAGDQRDWKRSTGRWVSAAYPVEPGSEYRLEVWVKTKDVTGQAYAHLAWQQGSQWLSENPTERLTGTNDWQKLSVTATAPVEADSLIVSFNLARSMGTAWFDDVRVAGKSQLPPRVEYVFNDTDRWFPFNFPADDTNLDAVDLTSFLDAPAGKHGFVLTKPDGHFHFENGGRARFFGTNVGGTACAPEKDQARIVAARLAKYGVNMLRLHSMDGRWGPLIDSGQQTSQSFDSAALDRVDYFVSELKRRGIYIYMDLLDYRWFRSADGVAHGDDFSHNWQGSMKGASCFDPRMIELQKDYATRLLTHRNPYTGLRYVDDPAVAVVETTNENSVFYFFRMSDLSLPHYRDALAKGWNDWLQERYGDRGKLAEAWQDGAGRSALENEEDPAAGTVALPFGLLSRLGPALEGKINEPLLAAPRVSDVLRFFAELQQDYYGEMHGHLRDIGVRVPIAGTNQTFFPADTYIDATMNDFMSRNQYWRHPSVHSKPFFRFANEAMVSVDLATQRNPLAVIASTSVAGKPQAVAEFNFPWPNEYRAEGLLISTAYACLQDWDIFLLFSFDPSGPNLSMFRSQSDPARWGTFPAAATMFHRHDIARGRNEIQVVHAADAVFAPRPDTAYSDYTEFRFLTFLSKVRNAFCGDVCRIDADAALACGPSADIAIEGPAKVIRLDANPWQRWLFKEFVAKAQELSLPGYAGMDGEAKRFDSDTGELSLDYGRGLCTIDTPCTKSAIGFLARAAAVDLGGMQIRCRTEFAAVTATSLDGKPIGESARVLLTCVARAENTGQGFSPPAEQQAARNPMSWMLPAEGRPPVIAEPVDADIRLPTVGRSLAYALDASGKRKGKVSLDVQGGAVRLNPANAGSIWIEIVADGGG
ncbi:MAG: hypothetical protein GXY83_17925 [Rhodopirellula sp.]|nr:hypothetical protein [Rhodopirellula sp.]